MNRAGKVLCIIGVGIIAVLLAASTVYACCGMTPTIADDPIVTGCPGDEITISGTITLVPNVPGEYMYYPDVENTLTIEITTPSGIVEAPISATVDNLQTNPYTDATWDFSATYTPTEVGTYTYVKTAVYWPGSYGDTSSVAGEFVVEECVALDIKPGSCPNPLNRKSKGLVPVAIVGTDFFDVTTVDVSSLLLAGIAPVKSEIDDVTEPGDYEPADCYDCFEEPAPITLPDGTIITYSGDGIADLVLHFDTQDLVEAINGGLSRGDCVSVLLTGALLDGTPLELSDSVVIVK